MARQVTASSMSRLNPWSNDGLREAQKEDPDIEAILEFMEYFSVRPSWQDISTLSPTAKRYWALWDSLHVRNGVLYRKWESEDGRSSKWQLILPKSRVSGVLKELYSSSTGGHFGVMKILQKVQERFYWNNSREDVEK